MRKVSNYKKILTRTQKVLYRVKSGYFATQLKPASSGFCRFWGWGFVGSGLFRSYPLVRLL
nr:MAG TPA: hypothetical protein [Caudoviricetes sp.]